MATGQSQLFNSTVSGGTSPYSYEWYLSLDPILGNTITNPGFETASFTGWNQEGPYNAIIRSDEQHTGSYSCASQYVWSPDSAPYLPFKITQKLPSVSSNLVTSVSCWGKWGVPSNDWLKVNYTDGYVSSINIGSYSSDWTYVALDLAPDKTVDSLILERTTSDGDIICIDDIEFSVNGSPVSGATSDSWTFTPSSAGPYTVYAKITDGVGVQATSNTVLVQIIFLRGPYYTWWGAEYWIVKFPGEHPVRLVSNP
jgi:hypothetical protein